MHNTAPFAVALVVLAGCTTHRAPRPTAAVPRAEAPPVPLDRPTDVTALATPSAPQGPVDFPTDPESVSLATTLFTWVATTAREIDRPLTLVRMTAAHPAYAARLYATAATVRDERSGTTLTLRLFAQRPPVLGLHWIAEGEQQATIAGPFALRAVEDWLNARPDVRSVSRQRLQGTAVLWSLSTTRGTVVCATETPSHGPIVESCWPERGAIAEVPDDAANYEYGRRNHLRVEYTLLDSGRRVRARIDEAGHVQRAEAPARRGAFGAAVAVGSRPQPPMGALAFLEARAAARAVRFSTGAEGTSCELDTRWRCGPVAAASP